MKKLVIGVIAAGALAAPAVATGQLPRDTGKPENPGCFGEFVGTAAQTGQVGEFVSGQASENFKGNDGDSIGEDGVPFFKALSCPGDFRGRQSLEDQP
jgi:hypothetical protein